MKKPITHFLSFCFFSFCFSSYAQFEDFEKSLAAYFELPREQIYLHLNKEVLVTGERLWYKGYLLNEKTGKPRTEVTNVNIGFFDAEGNLKKKLLSYAVDGHFKGSLAIDSLTTDGVHYLTVSTNWMRNFREDNTHVRALQIISKDFLVNMTEQSEKDLDIQFLPEGGDMVVGMSNIVGFKVLDEKGYGRPIQNVMIYDDQGSLISKATSNKMGMGKFEIFPQQGRSYYATSAINLEDIASYNLPKALPLGVNLSVKNSPYHSNLMVSVETNAATLKAKGGEYRLLVHRNDAMMFYGISLDDVNMRQTLSVDKQNLANGVNTFTLVDNQNRPIEERLVFINKGEVLTDVEVKLDYIDKDSLQLGILSKEWENADLSISVLPAETMSYLGERNIAETFLLRPFLKGHIENAAYYFKDIDTKKEVELDELLLTQGWSRYHWNDILNNPPEIKHRAESGLALVGTINGKIPDSLLLHKSANHGSQFISFEDENNTFLLTDFFPQKGEELSFSAVGRGGRLSAPKMSISLNQTGKPYFSKKYIANKPRPFWYRAPNPVTLKIPTGFVFNDDKVVQLENVTVTEELYQNYLEKAKKNIVVPQYLKNKISAITPEMAWETPNILDFIRRKGYEVRGVSGGEGVSIVSRRGAGINTSVGVNVILDDAPLQDLNFLTQINTAQIESYWFDRLSRYQGARSDLKETIYFYTVRGKELDITPNSDFKSSERVFTSKIQGGFEAPLDFYMPKYGTYLNESFSNFGAIHWEPSLSFQNQDELSFKFYDTGLKNLKVVIEGITSEGKLISTTKEIAVKRNL